MTYYYSTAYKERYYIEFYDKLNAKWRISIEDPTFSGSPTKIEAAADPFVWFGSGTEDQTECVLGSTGTLRLICTSSNVGLFVPGGIYPTEINNRRVIAKRNGTTMWQGFIKCEQYSQPMVGFPIEIDIPVASPLALADSIFMPEYGDWGTSTPMVTADLIRFVLGKLSCTFNYIYTNAPVYEDYRGNVQEQSNHWTQSDIVMTYFYKWDAAIIEPMTLKEVLEIVLYPYGHIRECCSDVCIMMDNVSKNGMYRMEVAAKTNYFKRYNPIGSVSIDSYDMFGDEINKSCIPAPKSVKFTRDFKENKDIFEFKDDMILSSYNPTSPTEYQLNGKVLYVDTISPTCINTQQMYTTSGNFSYARLFFVEAETAPYNSQKVLSYKYNMVEPLCILVNPNATIHFSTKAYVRTRTGYNKVRLTYKEYDFSSGEALKEDLCTQFKVTRGSHYLDSDASWKNTETYISPEELKNESGAFKIDFNEYREIGDKEAYRLGVYIKNTSSSKTVAVSVKLEYIEDTWFTTTLLIARLRGKTDFNKRIDIIGGTGESVDIEFKTMCGENKTEIEGAADIPYNSFCDNPAYINTNVRYMIDVEEMRGKSEDKFDIITSFKRISYGGLTYMPVATGMNAWNATMKVKLVSIN